MPRRPRIENAFEKGLFSARWLMAPMYLGLCIALAMLTIIFVRELAHYIPDVFTMTAEKMILVVLTLIDLSLAANLLLIVMFSGYENFVSKIDVGDHADRPEWMGKVDFSGLKMKLIASIVAISAIHLLKKFMEIGDSKTPTVISEVELKWLTIIHLTFVASGVLLGLMDWLTAKSGGKH